jgi:site-specific DNA-methyltransferase (adenine-specific)
MEDAYEIREGDCREVMRGMDADSIDAIVCDPPYGLSFMGKGWDHGVPGVEFWTEAMRVAKPGAHLLAFGGTRTYHRLACAIEDAGWEMRDLIAWISNKTFPKSHNLKDDWQGWGTALKPVLEPIAMARKPLVGTVAENVIAHGTGAINVNECRVLSDDGYQKAWDRPISTNIGAGSRGNFISDGTQHTVDIRANKPVGGRWPANVIHDGSEEATAPMGKAARFFYCAKASKADRGDGNHHPTVKPTALMRYLCRLVTQPGGIVLDPFCGSGSTGKAALLEGFRFIGIERESDYAAIARARIAAVESLHE